MITERTVVCRVAHRRLDHVSSPLAARRMAMVSGRRQTGTDEGDHLGDEGISAALRRDLIEALAKRPLPKNMASRPVAADGFRPCWTRAAAYRPRFAADQIG